LACIGALAPSEIEANAIVQPHFSQRKGPDCFDTNVGAAALRLQSNALVGRVAALGLLAFERTCQYHLYLFVFAFSQFRHRKWFPF
jgi:hypothetical protein